MDYTRRRIESWQDYKALDDVYFHVLTAETLVPLLPERLDQASWTVEPSVETYLPDDGDGIAPGRPCPTGCPHRPLPDSICLLDKHHVLLFGDDTINTGPIYAHLKESNSTGFAASGRRLGTSATQCAGRSSATSYGVG